MRDQQPGCALPQFGKHAIPPQPPLPSPYEKAHPFIGRCGGCRWIVSTPGYLYQVWYQSATAPGAVLPALSEYLQAEQRAVHVVKQGDTFLFRTQVGTPYDADVFCQRCGRPWVPELANALAKELMCNLRGKVAEMKLVHTAEVAGPV